MLPARLGSGSHAGAEVVADGVEFDGVNDFLSRSTDLTGNADGKNFTFSAWLYADRADSNYTTPLFYIGDDSSMRLRITTTSTGGDLAVWGYNAAGTAILVIAANQIKTPVKAWHHILISVNMDSNVLIYLNDQNISYTSSTFTAGQSLDFTPDAGMSFRIGRLRTTGDMGMQRLAHVYFDKTFRDLTQAANRRLFITAGRKPVSKASLIALNPIVYLPMDDPATAHVNKGTGGDFTLNGTIARAGRGPNQFNAPSVQMPSDATAQYLQRNSALSTAVNSSKFTVAFNLRLTSFPSGHGYVIYNHSGSSWAFFISTLNGVLNINAYNAANSSAGLQAQAVSAFVRNRNYRIVISIDMTNTAKRHVNVNGVAWPMTWSTFDVGATLMLSNPEFDVGGGPYGSIYSAGGALGGVWFDTGTYIDLLDAANLAKFVEGTNSDAKPVDPGVNGELPTGSAPDLYLPMFSKNYELNLGTGGTFSVVGGQVVGAKGPHEFWANIADFDGTNGYLTKSGGLTGATDSKAITLRFIINFDTINGVRHSAFTIGDAANVSKPFIIYEYNGRMYFGGGGSSSNTLLYADFGTFTAGVSYDVMISLDLSDASKRFVYVNGSAVSVTWSNYVDGLLYLSKTTDAVTVGKIGGEYLDGKVSELYFTNEYIDFSLEANRLKFRDAFGSPANLGASGEKPTGKKPLVYMRFDPASQGTNAGSGGNLTKSGNISDGGQL